MTERIRLLDCTLRDGGHLVGGNFGENVIKNVIKNLVDAKIDIIEAGFLWHEKCEPDFARYYTIKDLKKYLPENAKNSKFSLMADFIDLEHLEPYDGTVEYIRLSFKRHRLDWGLNTAKMLMDKGYKCFINPVNCNVYTDEEYLRVLERVNQLKPYGFSVVDTFGTLRKRDLTRLISLIDHNLHPDITIGLHLHENLGLSYSLAQHFIEIANPKRNIVIDCSLLGMGRTPGNLCTEQIMDHLNLEYGKLYNTEPTFDAIDDYIAPLKKKHAWGYSIPYALSAKYDLHRTYAEFLLGKRRLKVKDIQRILGQVSTEKAEMFDEEYIDQLYKAYMDVAIDDTAAIGKLTAELQDKNVLILSPGPSIVRYRDKIEKFIEEYRPIVFSVNFVPENFDANYTFCSNIKRYDNINRAKRKEKLIITSNLLQQDLIEYEYVVSHNELVYSADIYCDDSTIMLLNLLKICGVRNITVAGFDGFVGGNREFFDDHFDNSENDQDNNKKIKDILDRCYEKSDVIFLTPSVHRET